MCRCLHLCEWPPSEWEHSGQSMQIPRFYPAWEKKRETKSEKQPKKKCAENLAFGGSFILTSLWNSNEGCGFPSVSHFIWTSSPSLIGFRFKSVNSAVSAGSGGQEQRRRMRNTHVSPRYFIRLSKQKPIKPAWLCFRFGGGTGDISPRISR